LFITKYAVSNKASNTKHKFVIYTQHSKWIKLYENHKNQRNCTQQETQID